MTVSKRLRYEILRRDNHACRYCGATAPDVALTVDHVIPTTLGGTDDPGNLVAACKDCNAGKSSSSPDSPLVADVTEASLRWGRAVEVAAHGLLFELAENEELRRQFLDKWNTWTYGPDDNKKTVPLDQNWRDTLHALLARGLPIEIVKECVDIAMRRQNVALENIFRYFCGIAWRKIDEMTEIAKHIYDSWEAENGS